MSKINRLSYCNPYRLKAGGKCSIEDATLPLPDMLPYLVESENEKVYTNSGQSKKSVSRYEVKLTNNYTGQLRYTWTVTNASIVEPYDTTSKYIYVESDSVSDVTFTVKCTVTDGVKIEEVEETYTHEREAGQDFVSLTSISEESTGSCVFDTNNECTAVSSYLINGLGLNDSNIEWIVLNGEIISGQGTTSIVVNTIGDTDIDINITCNVSNSIGSDTTNADFTHTRTENVIQEVVIVEVTEVSPGGCDFYTQDTCVAESVYFIDAENYDSLWWAVTGNAVIVDGQGTDTVTIRSAEDEDVNFTLKCDVNNSVSYAQFVGDYVHNRTEIEILPVVVHSLTEISPGSCEFINSDCTATSIYTVQHDNGDTFQWTVVGGIITSGQGTGAVTIETEDNIDVTFNLSCLVSNRLFSDHISEEFTHTRTQTNDSVAVSDIIETSPGGCTYLINDTCDSSSDYQVSSTDAESHSWEVIGAIDSWEFINGDTEIRVHTSGNATIEFNVKCTAHGFFGGSNSKSKNFSHAREENAIITFDSDTVSMDSEEYTMDSQ